MRTLDESPRVPIWRALLLFAFVISYQLSWSLIGIKLAIDPKTASNLLLNQGLLAAILLTIVVLLGARKGFSLRAPSSQEWAWRATPIWLLVATSLPLAIVATLVDPSLTMAFVAISLLVGFNEEVVFRGFLLSALGGRGASTAIVASSVLFGLSHGLGFLQHPGSLVVAGQIVAATGIGLIFAVITIRSNTILPVVGLHALVDAVGLTAAGGANAALTTTSAAVVIIAGVVLLLIGVVMTIELARPPTHSDRIQVHSSQS